MDLSRSNATRSIVIATSLLGAGIVLLSGCSGSIPPATSPSTGTAPVALTPRGPLTRSRPDRRKTWISANIRGFTRLLFISDTTYRDVFIFGRSTHSLKPVGTITGFSVPGGMCTDASGDIWVTDAGTSQIFRYSPYGKLLHTLNDPGYLPVGCAINPINGDIAVTDIFQTNGAPGDVAIYGGRTRLPSRYVNPEQSRYFFDAYDPNGNLYVDGFTTVSGGSFTISELPSGSGTMQTIGVLGGTIYWPGGVNWDSSSKQLSVGDQSCNGVLYANCVYELAISGSVGFVNGSTTLLDDNGDNCGMDQGTLDGGDYYGGCYPTYTAGPSVGRWAYPSGGLPTAYNVGVVSEPVGSAVTTVKH